MLDVEVFRWRLYHPDPGLSYFHSVRKLRGGEIHVGLCDCASAQGEERQAKSLGRSVARRYFEWPGSLCLQKLADTGKAEKLFRAHYRIVQPDILFFKVFVGFWFKINVSRSKIFG